MHCMLMDLLHGFEVLSTTEETLFNSRSHIVFTWPFLHFLTLPAAVAAKLLFQFKSDLEFKCVSYLGLHLGRPNFPRQPPSF